MKKFLTNSLYILSFLFFSNSFAQDIPKNGAGDAIIELLEGDKNITKARYDSFWNKVGVNSYSEKRQIILFMQDNFLIAQDYQREIWACAQIAWNEKKVPECSKLKVKADLLRRGFKQIDHRESLKELMESSSGIILAAAERGKFTLNDSSETQMTLEIIEKTKNNLDNVFLRFEKVLVLNF